jgi:hypothetical protein
MIHGLINFYLTELTEKISKKIEKLKIK